MSVVEPTDPETHIALEGKELTWVMRERAEPTPGQRVQISLKSAEPSLLR